MTDGDRIDKSVIIKKWSEFGFGNSFSQKGPHGGPGKLDSGDMECLKDTLAYPHFKSAVWKLRVSVNNHSSIPVILKIAKKGRKENELEMRFYRKAGYTVREFLPKIYAMRSESEYVWVLMEYVRTLEALPSFHPKYWMNVMPSLAKLHASTFKKKQPQLESWLPNYHSKTMVKGRIEMIRSTAHYLEKGMRHNGLRGILAPAYAPLQQVLGQKTVFFSKSKPSRPQPHP